MAVRHTGMVQLLRHTQDIPLSRGRVSTGVRPTSTQDGSGESTTVAARYTGMILLRHTQDIPLSRGRLPPGVRPTTTQDGSGESTTVAVRHTGMVQLLRHTQDIPLSRGRLPPGVRPTTTQDGSGESTAMAARHTGNFVINYVMESSSSAVECQTRHQGSPGSNPSLLSFRSLGIFVLFFLCRCIRFC